MHPFWEIAIEPLLTARRARRVLEIGAFRGETTSRLIDLLGADGELHVVDPEPLFDPSEHARRAPGRYHFHRAVSHDALPGLPVFDAVLVDGDHNWFTVLHELRMLAATAAEAGAPLPLLILHDVCWPYGRRDLYYEPERIPEDARHPFARGGMVPGRSELAADEGVNPHLHNATHEGGPRNGVMTALEDFASEHPAPLRVVVLPVFNGLGIAAEQRLVAGCPSLAAQLDALESADGRLRLAALAESLRVNEQAARQTSIPAS